MKEHGLPNPNGCRCQECRMSKNIYQQDYQRRKKGKAPQPEKTAAWKAAVEAGIAGEFADYIVRTREPPLGLLRELAKGR